MWADVEVLRLLGAEFLRMIAMSLLLGPLHLLYRPNTPGSVSALVRLRTVATQSEKAFIPCLAQRLERVTCLSAEVPYYVDRHYIPADPNSRASAGRHLNPSGPSSTSGSSICSSSTTLRRTVFSPTTFRPIAIATCGSPLSLKGRVVACWSHGS